MEPDAHGPTDTACRSLSAREVATIEGGSMKKYDIAVIGSGAGLMVMEAALQQGLSCAIVEHSAFGGTCLNKGCIPSKMLVYPADLIREAERAARIGLHFKPPEIDFDNIAGRMWAQIGKHRQIEESLAGIPHLGVYKGTGEFTGPHTLRVKPTAGGPAEEFSADRFVIAAGARTRLPPVEGLEETGYVIAETFFGERFPKKPWKSLIILGGGAVGAEFAHIFSAYGTQVSIVDMAPLLLPLEEEEVSRFVMDSFRKSGIRVLTGSAAVRAAPTANGKALTLRDASSGKETTLEAEEIFVAAGVMSNGDLLRLDQAGVRTDSRGWIQTDAFLRTNAPNIYALGDINGKYQFRHKANYEAGILSRNLFTGSHIPASYDSVPWAVFTHPQVAHAGLTEREAQALGIEYYVGRNHYSEIASGISMAYTPGSDEDGFVKLLADKDRQLIGIHVVGYQAAALLQPFVYMMNTGYRCSEAPGALDSQENLCRCMDMIRPLVGVFETVERSMVIHPSLAELTAWALGRIDWSDNRSAS